MKKHFASMSMVPLLCMLLSTSVISAATIVDSGIKGKSVSYNQAGIDCEQTIQSDPKSVVPVWQLLNPVRIVDLFVRDFIMKCSTSRDCREPLMSATPPETSIDKVWYPVPPRELNAFSKSYR